MMLLLALLLWRRRSRAKRASETRAFRRKRLDKSSKFLLWFLGGWPSHSRSPPKSYRESGSAIGSDYDGRSEMEMENHDLGDRNGSERPPDWRRGGYDWRSEIGIEDQDMTDENGSERSQDLRRGRYDGRSEMEEMRDHDMTDRNGRFPHFARYVETNGSRRDGGGGRRDGRIASRGFGQYPFDSSDDAEKILRLPQPVRYRYPPSGTSFLDHAISRTADRYPYPDTNVPVVPNDRAGGFWERAADKMTSAPPRKRGEGYPVA
jgi:hypothetical protein